jgi:GR25 family glycosyltransferase involved in LPS biosynthesis
MKIKQIYIINLKRRKDKLKKMIKRINKIDKESKINVEIIEAVDGLNINEKYLEKNNIKLLNSWRDPFKNTNISNGEIGCALSHHHIWKKIIKNNYNYALILEDDADFVEDFINKFDNIDIPLNTDLMYLGRKKFVNIEKRYSTNLVKPEFSYWTVGYLLTYSGAIKLINSNFVDALIPVDEFLPILFGKEHPSSKIKYSSNYKFEKLIAYSVDPLLVNPEEGAFLDSEVEDSKSLNKLNETYKDHSINILINNRHNKTDKYKRFIESLDKFNLKYTTIENNDNMLDILHKLPSKKNEVMLFIDNMHSIVVTGLNEIIDTFLSFHEKIIFGTSKHNSNENTIYNYAEYYKYININSYIGYREEIIEFHKQSIEKRINYIKENNNVGIDKNCKLFLNLNNGIQDINVDIVRSRLVNKIKQNMPCFVTSTNDELDTVIFNNITNYIPLNFRGSYGYNKQYDLKDKINTKKIIVVAFVDNIVESLNTINKINHPTKNIKIIFYSKNNKHNVEIYKNNKNDYIDIIFKKYINKSKAIHELEEVIHNDDNNDIDYLLLIDGDIEIKNPKVLQNLITRNKNIVSPFMVNSISKIPNFRMTMGNEQLPDFQNIVNGRFKGCWKVPAINTIALIKKNIIQEIKLENLFDNFPKTSDYFLYLDNHDCYGLIK